MLSLHCLVNSEKMITSALRNFYPPPELIFFQWPFALPAKQFTIFSVIKVCFFIPVSYTHLPCMNSVLPIFTTIQFMQSESCLFIFIFYLGNAQYHYCLYCCNIYISVSYTHLDVYKRQVYPHSFVRSL